MWCTWRITPSSAGIPAARVCRANDGRWIAIETLLVVAAWSTTAAVDLAFLTRACLPGWTLGLALCALQGHYEHGGGTTSHYGWIYNRLFFNDGYYVEHHLRPATHWSRLGARLVPGARSSRWPPVLRWLDALTLDGLERLVLRSPWLQRFVVSVHARAFRRLLHDAGELRDVLAVGEGLFPRTALVLQ